MFEGMESEDKDPRKSLHVGEVAVPELAPDEAYIAVMASAINFNTVWTSIFEPLPTFGFLDRLGRESVWGARHALDYHVVGSDASGVVLQVGSAVRNWRPGDKVTVHCNYVDDQSPTAHDDSMLADNQRIWGFETNFGGLADLAVVKANQLMPKPGPPVLGGGGRQRPVQLDLLPDAGLPQRGPDHPGGQGAGLGCVGRARRLRRAVLPERWRPPRSAWCRRSRRWISSTISGSRRSSTARPPTTGSGRTSTPRTSPSGAAWARTSAAWSATTSTSSSSTPAARPWGPRCSRPSAAGTIVTCAATSGYMIEYDNRHLWMKLKTIKGSHFANYREAWDANQLVCEGKILPPLSAVHTLDNVGDAAYQVHQNLHEGKIGVLCLAPEEGLGIDDHELRDRVGEDRITLFRRHGA